MKIVNRKMYVSQREIDRCAEWLLGHCKIVIAGSALLLGLLLSVCLALPVHAAEAEKTMVMEFEEDFQYNQYCIWNYYLDVPAGNYALYLSGDFFKVVGVDSGIDYHCWQSYFLEDGTYNETYFFEGFKAGQVMNIPEERLYSLTVYYPVFDSREHALNYLETGSYDGALYIPTKPPVDWSVNHDFSKDFYNPDIPVPVLSHISYNGFTVDNADEDLYIDVILDSYLCGVQHVKTGSGILTGDKYDTLVSATWKYKSHYYNFADLSDIAVNDSIIDISELWDVDNSDLLSQDFELWSSEFPEHTYLPSYDKSKHKGTVLANSYKTYHTVGTNTAYSAMNLSGQGWVSFYVRFYDADMNVGQWVKYTFNHSCPVDVGGSVGGTDNISVSVVDNTAGIVTFPTKVTGTQDETGTPNYSVYNPYASFNNFSFDVNNLDTTAFWSSMADIIRDVGVVPRLVAQMFLFLPDWLLQMIFAGIGLIVVLRFVGR